MIKLLKIRQQKTPFMLTVILAVVFTLLFSSIALAAITRTLRQGNTGADVKELQSSLNTLGNYLVADGIFGPKTRLVVTNFQLKTGLVPDGIVGPLTLAALNKALKPAPKPNPTPSPTPTPSPSPTPTNNNTPGNQNTTPTTPPSGVSNGSTQPAPYVPPTTPTGKKEILGYVEDLDPSSYNSVSAYSSYMTSIATFTYKITPWGSLQGNTPYNTIQLAKSRGVKPLALIHNLNGSFDPALANSILGIPGNRSNLINNLLNVVRNNGYAGVNIDIEGIYKSDRSNYVNFLREVKQAFAPYGLTVTVAIPAKDYDNPWNSWTNGYDYQAIGQVADRITIMTYDENYGQSGPVASYPWVAKVVQYAASVIPKEKILLGIATYGYDFPGNRSYGTNYIKTKIVPYWGGQLSWNNQYSVPFYTYWYNGTQHTIYFENEYSNAIKMNLVNQYNLGGIAIWRLGFEDQAFWTTVRNKLG